MSEIAENRPLSAEEHALTRWLLEHGMPLAAGFLPQLPRARVVAQCGCGCASVDFAVDGRRPAPGGLTVLSDYEYDDAAGRRAGVCVFARDGVLAGLEVWAAHPDADTTTLPSTEILQPLEGARGV